MTLTALIVGAGIGGLSAAISLRKVGRDVRVYERAAVARVLRVHGRERFNVPGWSIAYSTIAYSCRFDELRFPAL